MADGRAAIGRVLVTGYRLQEISVGWDEATGNILLGNVAITSRLISSLSTKAGSYSCNATNIVNNLLIRQRHFTSFRHICSGKK